MFRAMTILVAEVQTARTGKRRKLLSLTRFGYQNLKGLENKMKRLTTVRFMSNNYGALQIFRTFLLTFLIKIGDIIIDLFHIIIFLAIADPGGFK